MKKDSSLLRERWVWTLVAVNLIIAALTGCRQEAVQQVDYTTKPAVSRTFAAGKLRLDLVVDRTVMTVSDRLTLSLSASAPEDLVVEFPDHGNRLGDFIVIEFRETTARTTGDGTVKITEDLILEPLLAGTYHIPPIRVAFWKPGENERGGQTLATDEVKVSVRSLLDKNENDDLERPPPPDQPRERMTLVWTGIGGVTVLSVFGALLYWWRGRKKGKRIVVIPFGPPHRGAYQALEKLLAEDLLARGEIKAFHVRLSDILRGYIEKRFSVVAPESTIEEFLVEIGNSGLLRTEHRIVLRDFLSRCDLVKFARHQPDDLEIERTVNLCRQFIKETESAVAAERRE